MKFLKVTDCRMGSGQKIEVVNMTKKEVKEDLKSNKSCNKNYPKHQMSLEYFELKEVRS